MENRQRASQNAGPARLTSAFDARWRPCDNDFVFPNSSSPEASEVKPSSTLNLFPLSFLYLDPYNSIASIPRTLLRVRDTERDNIVPSNHLPVFFTCCDRAQPLTLTSDGITHATIPTTTPLHAPGHAAHPSHPAVNRAYLTSNTTSSDLPFLPPPTCSVYEGTPRRPLPKPP